MARTDQGESSQRPPPPPAPLPPSERLRTRPDAVLVACRFFSFLTAVAAVLCVLVNALSAFQSFKHGRDVFGGIFRCYAIAIAVFVVVAETEWDFVFKFFRVMEFWAGRGMLQIFVSVMTRAFPDLHGEQPELVVLQVIASYLLLSCGLIYVISGILCLGFLKRARQHKELTREQAIKNLQELERQREELEELLIEERA